MPDIDNYLEQIKTARYGRDVRDAIHDSIEEINNCVIRYDLTASQAAASALQSEQNADSSANAAKMSENNAKVSESNAMVSEAKSKTSETNAAQAEKISKEYRDEVMQCLVGVNDIVTQINNMLTLSEFEIDADGYLNYTDDGAYVFSVDNYGYLNYEVKGA